MEFQSHVVVTSQSMNKNFWAPKPSCFVYKKVNAQPYLNTFEMILSLSCCPRWPRQVQSRVTVAGAIAIK
jgi:hypothetical protein